MGELGLSWGGVGEGGLTIFRLLFDSHNLTRDLSRYVRIPLRSPLDSYFYIFSPIRSDFRSPTRGSNWIPSIALRKPWMPKLPRLRASPCGATCRHVPRCPRAVSFALSLKMPFKNASGFLEGCGSPGSLGLHGLVPEPRIPKSINQKTLWGC